MSEFISKDIKTVKCNKINSNSNNKQNFLPLSISNYFSAHGGIPWELREVSDSQSKKKNTISSSVPVYTLIFFCFDWWSFLGAYQGSLFFLCLVICRKKIIKKCGFFNPISRSPNLAGFDLTSVEGCRLMANGSDLPTEYLAKFFAYSAYWICCPPRHFFQLQNPKTISLIAYLSAKLVAMTAAVFTLWHRNNMCFCTERNIQLNIFCLARQRESFKVPFSRFKNTECFPYLKFKALIH